MTTIGNAGIPELNDMLANVSVTTSVLPWKVCDVADKVGGSHIDGDSVGQRDKDRVELSMPESGSIPINSIACRVAIVCTVGSDGPASLADGS